MGKDGGKIKGGGRRSGKAGEAGRSRSGAATLARSPSQLMHRALQRALDIYAEEVESEGPTQRQYAVLSATAANDGASQAELVALTGIDRSTLADLVARLCDRGLIARRRSAADSRANTLSLTEAGRAALATASPRAEAADRRLLALLPKSRRDGFLDQLAVIADPASRSAKERKREARATRAGKKRAGNKAAPAAEPGVP